MSLHERWQTMEGEQLKSAAEFGLHQLAANQLGQRVLGLVRGGERIESTRLHTMVAGIEFENPLMVGAGWDKKGRAVDGLYELGFAGTEVGSVLVHPQAGNPRPRLFYKDGAGLNRLGFNGPGMEAVADNLEHQQLPGIVGISLGKNKLTLDSQAPWAHAAVADRLFDYADYFAINVASPNTPGLRDLLDPRPLTDIVQAVNEVRGDVPLFIKTTVDLDLPQLDQVLQVAIDNEVDGIIDTNTTIDDHLKGWYGWKGEAGGLSGDVDPFRHKANQRMRYITQHTRDDGLQRIGVGAINTAGEAFQRMEAGAQVVQIVTGIRQRGPRVAQSINAGLLSIMNRESITNIEEIIGRTA